MSWIIQHLTSNEQQRHLEVVHVNFSPLRGPGSVKSQFPLPASRLVRICPAAGTGSSASAAKGSDMGEIILPRRMFLWSMAVIYLVAFVSLYVQIPGEIYNFCSVCGSNLSQLLGFVVLCVSCFAADLVLCLPACSTLFGEEPPGSFSLLRANLTS